MSPNVDSVLPALPFGVLPLCFGIWQRSKELAPQRWPQIDGRIINSTIKKERIRGGFQYVPIIEYEYCYKDKTYSSSQRRAGNYISGSREEAEVIGSRYSIGSSVKVFVNPSNPDNAVLEFGTTPLSWICIILGLFITTLMTIGLFVR